MTPAPKVVLLILTWNRRDDVLRCVASLSRLTYPNCLPVVVDNGSADDTVAALRERYAHLTIIENAQNLGYAGGNNVGVRWALQHGADYVLIINNDTEVTAEMVSELVRIAESDPSIGVVGCRNVLMGDPSRLWGAYGELTYGPFVVRTAGEGAPDGAVWQVVKDADWVIGNGYLWRRTALERVGLLDESFFAYHEDVDWCLRARAAGFRVVYAGTAAILHKGAANAAATERHSVLTWYVLGRNGVRLVRTYASWQRALRFAVFCVSASVFRLGRAAFLRIASARTRARGAELWAMEVAYVRGMVDALRGRPIPFERLGMAGAALPSRSEVQGNSK